MESAYGSWLGDKSGKDIKEIIVRCSRLNCKVDTKDSSLKITETGDCLKFESGISAGSLDLSKGSAELLLCQTGPEAIDGLQNALRLLLGRVLVEKDGLLLHAAAVKADNGKSIVMAGHSGAGKTTLSRFFAEAGREVYSDDLCCLKIEKESEVNLYSAPLGSEQIGWFSGARRLSAIFLLEQAKSASVSEPIPRVSAAAQIAAAVPFLAGYSAQTRKNILMIAARVASKIPVRKAMLRRETKAVQIIEEFI
jgi:hypothetical protein